MATCRHGGYRELRDLGFYLDETQRMVYPLSSQFRDRESNRRVFSSGFHHDCRNYPRRNRSPVIEKRALDRDEPGPRSEVMGKQNGGPVRTENKDNLTKKRKYSPIILDRDELRQLDIGSNRSGMAGKGLSVNETLAPLAPQTELSDILAVSPQHSGMDDGEIELGLIEEDEDFYTVARTISSSRWADEDDLDIVAPEKQRRISSLDKNTTKKVLTPDPGEVMTDGSDQALSRSSGSDRAEREDDYMMVDGQGRANRSDHSSLRGYESEFSREEIPEPSNPPKRRINMLQGCRIVDEFERLNKINEGTYGVVYRAMDNKTGEVVALKKVKMEKEKEGFPLTSLREINILLSLNHPSIVDVKEVVMGSSLDSIFMVMEYMEHDLKGIMDTMKHPYSQSEVKCLMLQLLEGVRYLHDNWILHR